MHKIVLIDDSTFNIKVLTSILGNNYHIYSAYSGQEGLDLVQEVLPSLVLVDIIMPGLDGFQVIAQLKLNEKTWDIPVIFLTGLSDTDSEEQGFALGAVDYITKPFSPNIVKARVKTHTELYEYRRIVEHIAQLDGLTGLPNRQHYERRVRELWSLAVQEETLFSMALVSVDFFKEYREKYGYTYGDDIIQSVGMISQTMLRKSRDFCARYGGEEFILLFPDTDKDSAAAIAEAIRSAVEGLQIPHATSACSSVVTVSIGGATIAPNGENDFEEFMDTVDSMLYEAKEQGANQVVWAEVR